MSGDVTEMMPPAEVADQRAADGALLSAFPRVAAVVVTYNRKDLLLECVDAILAQTVSTLCDVIVIDNLSTDGTTEALAPYVRDGSVTYVRMEQNLGGAGGFQRGMREAVERDYDYVWAMDDDCLPRPDALEYLVAYAEALEGQFGFLSSKVLWKDGSICKMNVQRRSIYKPLDDFDHTAQALQVATFVSFFAPTRVVREVGLPIKEFFIWTDDWEYSRRISRRYPCYFVAESVVVHQCAQNRNTNIVDEADNARFGRYRGMYRNSLYLYRREGLPGWLYAFTRAGSHLAKIWLKSPSAKLERTKTVVRGTADGVRFNPPVEFVEGSGSGSGSGSNRLA